MIDKYASKLDMKSDPKKVIQDRLDRQLMRETTIFVVVLLVAGAGLDEFARFVWSIMS